MSADVVGWWELESWSQAFDDGRLLNPFGEQPLGRLIYSSDGDFSVMICKADIPQFSTGFQWTAEDEEKARAYDGVLAYFGKYEFDGSEMQHQVEASLYPNWIGLTQVRKASIKGNVLTLSARLEKDTDQARTVSLVWKSLDSR